jgi:hypothetical protein
LFCDRRKEGVRYSDAYQCSGEGLAALERTIVQKFEPLEAALLQRIRKGALASPQTSDKIKTVENASPVWLRQTKPSAAVDLFIL